MMVCGAKCHFYGYCRILVFVTIMASIVVQLGCSAFLLFLVIFTQFRGFQQSLDMEYDTLVWAEADFMVVSMISVWI